MKHPIPHLKWGMGGGKVTVCVALCGLGKSWHKKSIDNLKKYSDLLNFKSTTKSDITTFLATRPMLAGNNDHRCGTNGDHINSNNSINGPQQADIGIGKLSDDSKGTEQEKGKIF